ncbi:hypothetical protein, partial [Telmatospirillum siberiense]|uniref:hypothetical protein n=1 Tax=Telmatospirillum siberiense TaxID=382514 RepID=UPI001A7E1B3E
SQKGFIPRLGSAAALNRGYPENAGEKVHFRATNIGGMRSAFPPYARSPMRPRSANRRQISAFRPSRASKAL